MIEFPPLARVAAMGLAGALPPPAPSLSWSQLFADALDERAIPLIADAIGSGSLVVSEAQATAVVAAHGTLMESCVMLERTTLRVCDLFEKARVDFRLLKGPAVAHLDYPNPASRAFGDVDLLVRSSAYEAALRVLEGVGARRRSPEVRSGFDRRFGKGVCMILPDGVQVDVHRTLASGPFGFTIDLDSLFLGSDAVPMGGHSIPVLTREHRFVHACYHASLGDPSPRVVTLRDVAQLLLETDVDFDRVRAHALEWRGGIVVAHAISVSWEQLGLEESVASRWARSYVPTRSEQRWLAAYLGPDRSYARQMVAAVPAIPGVSAKLAYLRALVMVDKGYIGRHDGGYARRILRAWRSRPAWGRST